VWRDLAARLVEINLAIENLDGWVTRPEDVDELKRLETLRDELQQALGSKRLSRSLRRELAKGSRQATNSPANDPRD
jgi:hypothetical protein